MALRPGISLVSEGYVVMTIELNTSKAWDYKYMYGHYLLQIPFHKNYVLFLKLCLDEHGLALVLGNFCERRNH